VSHSFKAAGAPATGRTNSLFNLWLDFEDAKNSMRDFKELFRVSPEPR
jgi:hypothetical protein